MLLLDVTSNSIAYNFTAHRPPGCPITHHARGRADALVHFAGLVDYDFHNVVLPPVDIASRMSSQTFLGERRAIDDAE